MAGRNVIPTNVSLPCPAGQHQPKVPPEPVHHNQPGRRSALPSTRELWSHSTPLLATPSMAYSPSYALVTGLILEIFALRHPTDTLLKIAATASSVAYLVLFIIYKPPGSFMTVWPLGMNIFLLSGRCWNFLWLRDSEHFRRLQGNNHEQVDEDKKPAESKRCSDDAMPSPTVHSHTFIDALDIALAFRGVGWSFEAKGLPKLPYHSVLSFTISQLQNALFQYLILDLAITFANRRWYTTSEATLPGRLFLGAVMVLYVRWTMDIPYRVVSILAVIFSNSVPSNWPPMFGGWHHAFTVRRFWSHSWHQGMRLLAEPPMRHIVHYVLRLERRSYASKWCTIFGNFFFAFMDHAYGRIMAGGNPKADAVFFALQPVAIWTEETVRDVAVKCGLLDPIRITSTEKMLGYVWVVVFQCWAFLYFMEGAVRIEEGSPGVLLIEPAFGVSLFGRLCK